MHSKEFYNEQSYEKACFLLFVRKEKHTILDMMTIWLPGQSSWLTNDMPLCHWNASEFLKNGTWFENLMKKTYKALAIKLWKYYVNLKLFLLFQFFICNCTAKMKFPAKKIEFFFCINGAVRTNHVHRILGIKLYVPSPCYVFRYFTK